MAWSTAADSRLMRLTMNDILAQTYTTMSQVDLDLATNLFAALFDNNVTPDVDATTTLSAYTGASSTWQAAGGATGGNQVFHAGGSWPAGGIVVPSPAVSVVAGGIVKFTSAALASGASATMSNIRGMMMYFNNATGGGQTKPVLGYWYFGSDFAVTAGTLTITPNASGLFRLTT